MTRETHAICAQMNYFMDINNQKYGVRDSIKMNEEKNNKKSDSRFLGFKLQLCQLSHETHSKLYNLYSSKMVIRIAPISDGCYRGYRSE